MKKEEVKQVSCFLDSDNKRGVELNANIEKYKSGEERANTNRNMVYIFNTFMDKYENNLESLPEVIARTVHAESFSENDPKGNKKEVVQSVSHSVQLFPLKFTEEVNLRFTSFWKNCVKSLGFKLTKSHLYNVILLDFIQHNKLNDLQDILNFYTQAKFELSNTEEIEFKELLEKVNSLLSKGDDNE